MTIYNATAKKDITGWSGIFTKIADYSTNDYQKKHNPNYIPNCVHGKVLLYPQRKHRWVRCRELGWAGLDCYFRTYNTKKIEALMDARLGTSYYFNGELKERYSFANMEYPEIVTELELNEWAIDKTQGRYSLLQASLICSDLTELNGG